MQNVMKVTKYLIFTLSFYFHTSNAQSISVKKLLSLQTSSQLNIQDYLETNSWKIRRIETLKDLDSALFSSSVTIKLEAYLKQNTHLLNEAAWIQFENIHIPEISSGQDMNYLTLHTPNFLLFRAVDLNLKNPYLRKFECSLDFTYFGDSLHSTILNEIQSLQVPENSTNIETSKNIIIRTYRLSNQVIELTSFLRYNITKKNVPMYSLAIYSLSDYKYLNKE